MRRSGTTVAGALGSHSIDFQQEQQPPHRTAEREQLLSQLAGKLQSDGWRQLGALPGGQWCQQRFGR